MTLITSPLAMGANGLPIINQNNLNQLAGIRFDLTRSAFDAAVTAERANLTNNGTTNGVWPAGQKIGIFGEVGTRIWFVGGSAAASHARNVSYQGKTYALAADANVFGPTTGAPTGGADGDYAVDGAAGLIYGPRASGTWPSGVALVTETNINELTPVAAVTPTLKVPTFDLTTGLPANEFSIAQLVTYLSTIFSMPPAPIVGFYLNGATNPKLKAAVYRVKAGTSRAKIVMKGDSTTVGQGAGTTAADSYGLTGARPNRIAKVLAGLMSSSGTPALDGSIVSWNAVDITSVNPTFYDPRASEMSPYWGNNDDATFAGGGYYTTNTGKYQFTPDTAVDTFEIVYYNSNNYVLNFDIDGSAPSTGPASVTVTSGTGMSKVTLKAASVGTHTLNIASTSAAGAGAVRGFTAYNSTQSAFDIIVHAALGAVSADQSATNSNGWGNNDSLGYDAPDLTTINLGLNDMNNAVSVSTYIANLQAIITKAKISGDVLLIFPTPASGNYNNNVAAFNTAAKNLAATAGVPFLSLYEHYGPWNSTFGARQFDGIVHPNAALYAEIAGIMKSAIDAMVAA